MTLNIDDIKKLTSVPKEYVSDSKMIDYLYEINPNIFENVDERLKLSRKLEDNLIEQLKNGTMVLTEKNIKLLDLFFSVDIIDILDKHFEYIYLINKDNFSQTGIGRDHELVELLEKNNVQINDSTPYLATLCGDYINNQYINNEADLKDIIPYFINWGPIEQDDFIKEYIKKGNCDLSIFYREDLYDENTILPFFKDTNIENIDNKLVIKSRNIEGLLSLLNFNLPFKISDVYLDNDKYLAEKKSSYMDSDDFNAPYKLYVESEKILNLLRKVNEEDINLHVKNGLSISSNLKDDIEFLDLCGDVGNVQLTNFDSDHINDFKELLNKAAEHPGVVVDLRLDSFMENENFFLNLDTDVPINIVSLESVDILSLNEMKQLNSKMDDMVAGIKDSNLSTYEKYIAAYNIVKSLKKYRFYLNNEKMDEYISDQSRNPYLMLTNQYAVCAGYSSLLQMLLKKVDIPSHYWVLNISEKSKDVALGNSSKDDAHARLYINLVDDKYGINGYYMCDPTWDNTDKETSDLYGYKYLNMSCGESHDYGPDSSSYHFFEYDEDVFNDQMFLNTDKYLEKNESLNEVFDIVKDLDPDFYVQLDKLKKIEDDSLSLKMQQEAIRKHFKEKTYRTISLENKYNAIISVLEYQNKREFSYDEKEQLREDLYNIDHDLPLAVEEELSAVIDIGFDDFRDFTEDNNENELDSMFDDNEIIDEDINELDFK